jgi:DNA-binding transcriptional regulator YdaS (Cro superfamily)
MPTFQLMGIAPEPFAPLFQLSDAALEKLGAVRRFATESPGFPCRVSLEDAAIGEELLLLPFEHQPAASPYRASGPIYVRRGAKQRKLAAGEIPPYVSQRLMSVRAYDAAHMMISAAVCEGAVLADELARHFHNAAAAYIHLHNAKQGCFSCVVNRA